MSALPIFEWKTCASAIPAQKGKRYAIYKRKVKKWDRLPMHGVMGYDWCIFLKDAVITVLRRKRGCIPLEVVMSDAPFDYYGMVEFAGRCVGGRVLIGGLGLGILTNLLANRRDVESITVVEIEPEIAEMVEPYLSEEVPIEVIRGDVFEVFPKLAYEEGREYDCVVVDIWSGRPPDVGESEWERHLDESYEDAKMIVQDCFPDAQHLFWGRQKEFEDELIEMHIAADRAYRQRLRKILK